MGTSQSSRGPGGGVPLVPPWVPPPPVNADGGVPPDTSDGQDVSSLPALGSPLAAPGRFGSARLALGSFARSGDLASMRRGCSEYVRKGYGGHAGASRRFEGTARTAGSLYGALSGFVTGAPGEFTGTLDRAVLQGRSAREIIDAVIEAVRP